MREYRSWMKAHDIHPKRSREERLALSIWQAFSSDIIERDNRINELESLLKQQNEVLIAIKRSGLIKE